MKQYKDLINHIINNGTNHSDRTGVGTTSVFGYQTRFNLDPFPILTTKRIAFKTLTRELLWFLSGSCNNERLLSTGCKIWNEWADEDHTERFGRKINDLGPVYSHQWRNFGAYFNHLDKRDDEYYSIPNKRYICPGYEDNGTDQIKWLIEEIKKNPNSRRLIVTGWHPQEQNEVVLPPCHTLFHFYVRDGMISCQLYQRSADSFLGVPFNISSYALLTCMIAHVCGLKPKEFIHSFGDLHIYNNHKEQVALQLSRECLPLPRLELNPALANTGFDGLLKFTVEDINLIGYESHDTIKAPVAV